VHLVAIFVSEKESFDYRNAKHRHGKVKTHNQKWR